MNVISQMNNQIHKECYGKCERCVWRDNRGCSEWHYGYFDKVMEKENNNV